MPPKHEARAVSCAPSLLRARPLTAESFAPFGDVLRVPQEVGTRTYFDGALASLKPQTPASLSLILAAPSPARPVPVTIIERHRLTSQSFVPMAPTPWLVVVAPDAPDGSPDLAAAVAFLPGPGQGITLKSGVWHAPLTVLEAPAPFAIFMWRDFGPDDEDFADITPFTVVL
ncbi:Ureidoglycolate hydrolase [Xanthobacter versatilis]|uniref:Ureidoglycolate hydrolase n=1 Tax=Xanthobacter autotrophicus (strain ATCC BAA-1158 / Py2) TaxID=78245 RepID=A7IKR1_XANP2|nr:Ureidoglycolate hydrolase [Xanthobacter autotrophicus Py2]